MTWTAPRTWVTDENPTAATLNTHVRDNLDAAAGAAKAACRVYNSAALSIPNSAGTDLTFNSERFDTQGLHSTSTNTNRITIPTGWGGLWLIGASVFFAGSATGTRQASIVLNGATALVIDAGDGDATGNGLTPQCIYRLAAADYVTAQVFQSSGGALNVNATGNYTPEFWAVWLGA